MKSSTVKYWIRKAQRRDKDAFTELMQFYRNASIDERYRLPMELYYSQGFGMREIASLLPLPLNTVKTRAVRGRKPLQYRSQNRFSD